jgi:hypothetical protein
MKLYQLNEAITTVFTISNKKLFLRAANAKNTLYVSVCFPGILLHVMTLSGQAD